MRVTREEDMVFTEEMLKGSIHSAGSAARQVSEKLRAFGMKGLDGDIVGRAISDLMAQTGDGSGHCYTGDVRANWCFDEDGTMKFTIEYTRVE